MSDGAVVERTTGRNGTAAKPLSLVGIPRLRHYEKSIAGLGYLALICLVFAQVVFLSKSLMPLLFYPYGNAATSAPSSVRTPEHTYSVDLATPAYYETPMDRFVGLMSLPEHATRGCGGMPPCSALGSRRSSRGVCRATSHRSSGNDGGRFASSSSAWRCRVCSNCQAHGSWIHTPR